MHLVNEEMVICFEDFPIVDILLIVSLRCYLAHFFILSPFPAIFPVNLLLEVDAFRISPGALHT